ncbi:PucR family transcriptional regulator [Nocardia thailandica]|uniref:PucR family transcriptional regulator n=1 Tax=Nocardia thailandica TaxID=257275 RepID=A0ABW6PRX1_9NOCA
MSVDTDPQQSLTISGMPMSSPLKDVRALSRQMVGHFVAHVAPCGTMPRGTIAGDVTTITRVCLEFAVSMLDGRDLPEKVRRVEAAAEGWAREGVPIDTIHHSLSEGFKIGLELVVSKATAQDYDNLLGGVRVFMEIIETLTARVSRAYVRELRAVAGEHHTAAQTLTSALLGGHSTSTMAQECGIAVAERYLVLALAIPGHPGESDPRLDATVVARRKLRRVQAELAVWCGESVLSLLSTDGGTVLLPEGALDDAGIEELVPRLSRAAQVGVTACLVEAPTAAIPHAADQAHELLDMVQRIEVVPGLYRFDEFALEYQLTRPGPGRDSLGALLSPLDEYPELLETLQRHIANNLNRQRTARMMHIHTNTVDYRLRRIANLTGFDPAKASGLWYLRSALVARTYR